MEPSLVLSRIRLTGALESFVQVSPKANVSSKHASASCIPSLPVKGDAKVSLRCSILLCNVHQYLMFSMSIDNSVSTSI